MKLFGSSPPLEGASLSCCSRRSDLRCPDKGSRIMSRRLPSLGFAFFRHAAQKGAPFTRAIRVIRVQR